MTYSESPFSQLSDELWHVFGGRRRFPTTRARWGLVSNTSCWGGGGGAKGEPKGEPPEISQTT